MCVCVLFVLFTMYGYCFRNIQFRSQINLVSTTASPVMIVPSVSTVPTIATALGSVCRRVRPALDLHRVSVASVALATLNAVHQHLIVMAGFVKNRVRVCSVECVILDALAIILKVDVSLAFAVIAVGIGVNHDLLWNCTTMTSQVVCVCVLLLLLLQSAAGLALPVLTVRMVFAVSRLVQALSVPILQSCKQDCADDDFKPISFIFELNIIVPFCFIHCRPNFTIVPATY